jgi:hypothetical protein
MPNAFIWGFRLAEMGEILDAAFEKIQRHRANLGTHRHTSYGGGKTRGA